MRSLSRIGIIAIALFGISAVACNSADPTPTPPPVGKSIEVQLDEWSVSPSVFQVSAGPVSFTANNVGTLLHELVILRTDLPPNSLPLADDGRRVDESALAGLIGEIEELPAGESRTAEFNLSEPGNYVLFCNIPGHYAQGMAISIRAE